MANEPKTAEEFARTIIEGCGGMNDFEKYELVVWNMPERVAAALWTLRCLANPQCEGSQTAIDAILVKRCRESGDALGEVIREAELHLHQMAPHVRERKTAQILERLISAAAGKVTTQS